jgi:hypothetical protein
MIASNVAPAVAQLLIIHTLGAGWIAWRDADHANGITDAALIAAPAGPVAATMRYFKSVLAR